MSKFKVGDTVVCGIHSITGNRFKGRIARIIGVYVSGYQGIFTNDIRHVIDIDYYWRWDETELSLLEEPIIAINQVCSSCKLPAPHAKPNKDNAYVCKSCIVLESLQ